MKLKLILFLFAFFVFAQNSFTQTDYRGKLEFSLSVNKTEWREEDKIITKLSVQNNSGKKIKLQLSPNFYLVKEGINEKDLADVGYYTYYSAAKMETTKDNGKIFVISDEDKKMFFPLINLENGESKTVEMDLTKLAWGKSISAYRPFGSWFSAIPKGNYKLYFAMRTGEKETFSYQEYTVTRDKKIESNRVSLVLRDGEEN